jgi:hypothetical protein
LTEPVRQRINVRRLRGRRTRRSRQRRPRTATASSTSRCTSSRAPKYACRQVGAAPTTTRNR